MKRTLPFFTAALLTAPAISQNWTVGVPVDFLLTELTLSGGGCFPSPDYTFNFSSFNVSGIEYVWVVQSITAGGIYITPGPTPLNMGDTVAVTGVHTVYFPSGSGTLVLGFRAKGTPTTAGQPHQCSFSSLWLSNLGICPDGLSQNVSFTPCTVQPGTVGLADNTDIAQQLQFPSPANGNTLRIVDPSVRGVEVFNACGSRMASITSGSLVCDWSEGVYFVRVSSAAGVRSERMVLRRW